jgi:hypothetical protein
VRPPILPQPWQSDFSYLYPAQADLSWKIMSQPRPAGRGRPRKFGRPARSVAVTLPVDVIERLEGIDSDLSRAIVRLAARGRRERSAALEAELSHFGRRAVIVVNPSRSLRAIRGVELVPLPSGRALISLDRTLSPEAFELRLRDRLEAGVPPADAAGLRQVVGVLAGARRDGQPRLQARTILVLETVRVRAASRGRPGRA